MDYYVEHRLLTVAMERHIKKYPDVPHPKMSRLLEEVLKDMEETDLKDSFKE